MRTLTIMICALLLQAFSLSVYAQQFFKLPNLDNLKHITTRDSDHASDIPGKVYPAYIAVIDGRSVQPTSPVGGLAATKHTFRLAPGDHTLRLVADLSDATGTLSTGPTYTPRGEQPGEIKLFVEAGRQYYLGARLTGSRRDEWEPVVWSVKDIENYRHSIAR